MMKIPSGERIKGKLELFASCLEHAYIHHTRLNTLCIPTFLECPACFQGIKIYVNENATETDKRGKGISQRISIRQ